MPLRRMLPATMVLAAALVVFQDPLRAQLPSSLVCPRILGETDTTWTLRCDAEAKRKAERDEQQRREEQERRVRDVQQATAETARQRAILEKQPPLAAAGNRLLGRWETSTRPPSSGDPFAQLTAMVSGCGVLLGDGIVEFGANRWAIYDETGRNDMGAIEYRAGANAAVFGLPAKDSNVALLPFEFDTPDQIHLAGVVCTLKRTNATVPAGRASTASRGSATAPSSAPSSSPTRSPMDRFNGKRGYDCPAPSADVAADSCTGEAPNDTCVIVRVDQPLKNGVPTTFTETVAAFTKRIAACRQRPLIFLNGELFFAP